MYDIFKDTLTLSADKAFGPTLEGEGEYVGYPSVFMRLANCNLTCKGFSTLDSPNGCDSYVSWIVKNKMTFKEIFDYYEENNLVEPLRKGAIWKCTGGEPLIQQGKLMDFVAAFQVHFGLLPRIDFETNATIMPHPDWKDIYDATFTTSPKLTTNGDPESRTYKPDVLRYHREIGSGFKFVVTCSEDIDEIWRKYVNDDNGINVPKERIWLMPACGSRAEHIERAPAVAEYAKHLGVKFSPRLHVMLWDRLLKV